MVLICSVRDELGIGGGRTPNRKTVLRLLRNHGPLHRAELARRSGLSRTTVSTVVDSLMTEGLVVAVGADDPIGGVDRQPGRPGELLGVDPASGRVVGVAFSYHEVRVIVVDLAQQPLTELVEALPAGQDWQGDLETGVRLVNEALASCGSAPSDVLGVGLGVPGPLDRRRGAAGASSSSAWVGSLPAEKLAGRLGLPVLLDNTARLSLLSEVRWGAGAGYQNVAYVKLSSGVGGGFLIDGRLLRGSVGAAGEIGHVSVEASGRLCRCGSRGCLEAYASVPAVVESLRPVLGAGINLELVLAALAADDRCVARTFADLGGLVGCAMANAVNLFNPEVVVVGGELAAAGEALLAPIRQAIECQSLRLAGHDVEVVTARLGPRASALGGIALVLREEDRLVQPAEGDEILATAEPAGRGGKARRRQLEEAGP